MARRQPFNIFPPWTATRDESDDTPFSKLSQDCRENLLELARIFHSIDKTIINEATIDSARISNQDPSTKETLRLGLLFRDINEFEEFHKYTHFSVPKSNEELFETLIGERLEKDNYIWNIAAKYLLEYQGLNANHIEWDVAKDIASSILDLRGDAWVVFDDIAEELARHPELFRAICIKLRVLNLFVTVGNRTDPHSPDQPERRKYNYWRLYYEKKKASSAVYSQAQHDRNATLLAVVFATTILSIIPISFAWHRSNTLHGTTQDPDFYFQIQNSMMQFLGLFTAMFPIYRHSTAHAWRWAQIFTALGATSSLASIPLYLYTPTIWSAAASYFGSAAQAGMALLLTIMADSVVSVKQDKNE